MGQAFRVATHFLVSRHGLALWCRDPLFGVTTRSGFLGVATRGANETRQLASYSDSTRSKLDSCELDSKC